MSRYTEIRDKAKPYYTPLKWQHIQLVLRVAKAIKKKRLSDTLSASILYHDTAKRDMGGTNHGLNGSKIALKDLSQSFSPLLLQTIVQAIKEHNLDLRISNLKTLLSNIKNFSSPLALLLAIADDVRPLDLLQTWNKTLSYNFKHTPDNSPLLLYTRMYTRLHPRKRMPLLKYYKDLFLTINKPFIDWLDSLDVLKVRAKMDQYRKQNNLK